MPIIRIIAKTVIF